jgi:hypothetical protein
MIIEDVPDAIWDVITGTETLSEVELELRQSVANCAKNYDWSRLLVLLTQHPELVNTVRPGGKSWFAPIHQAAHGGASPEVVRALLDLGAWRTLKNAAGDRAVDIARAKSHAKLLAILDPVFMQSVPQPILEGIQAHFHELIRQRAGELVREHMLRLPVLEPILEFPPRKFWFAIPGMYGGFAYWLVEGRTSTVLVSESWCRIAGGSGQRHEINAHGCRLVDRGFV